MKRLSLVRKQPLRGLGLAACALASLGLAAASAQVYVMPAYTGDSGKDLGFYFGGDVGPSFMPNFQSSRYGFPANFTPRTGVRFGLEPGYNFLSNGRLTLGAEFETGVIYNSLSSVNPSGSLVSFHGNYTQVPMLGNLVLKLRTGSCVTPYIGVGGGGDYSETTTHWYGFYDSDHCNNQVNPAAQGKAGVLFRVNSISDFGLGYKFLADFPSEGKYIATHTVTASYTVRF